MGQQKSNWIEYPLYGGEVVVEFLPSKHWYHLKGAPRFPLITSVTGATGVYDKSQALIKWATKTDIDYIEEFVNSQDVLNKETLLPVIAEARVEHDAKKDKAASIGDIVHCFCEQFVKATIANEDLNIETLWTSALAQVDEENNIKLAELDPALFAEIKEKAMGGINSFLDWYSQHDVEFISSERVVYSREHNFVGKNDFHAIIDGVRTVGDFKTSKGVYDDHRFQLSAYWGAMEEEDGAQNDQGMIVKIDKEGAGFEVKTIDRDEHLKNYPVFLALLTVKERKKELDKEWRQANK